VGIHPRGLLATYAGQASDLQDGAAGRADTTDRNLRLHYLGACANSYLGLSNPAESSAATNFPTGSLSARPTLELLTAPSKATPSP